DVTPPLVVSESDAVTLDHDQRVRGEVLHLVEIDHHVAGGRAQIDRVDTGVGHGHSLSLSDQQVKASKKRLIDRSNVNDGVLTCLTKEPYHRLRCPYDGAGRAHAGLHGRAQPPAGLEGPRAPGR